MQPYHINGVTILTLRDPFPEPTYLNLFGNNVENSR